MLLRLKKDRPLPENKTHFSPRAAYTGLALINKCGVSCPRRRAIHAGQAMYMPNIYR